MNHLKLFRKLLIVSLALVLAAGVPLRSYALEADAEEVQEEAQAEISAEEVQEEMQAEISAEEIQEEAPAEMPAEEVAEEAPAEMPAEDVQEEAPAELPAEAFTEDAGEESYTDGEEWEEVTESYTEEALDYGVQAGWRLDGNGWWYQDENGGWPANQWRWIDGAWYFFAQSGYMQTGWLLTGDIWYYLSGSGAMVTGWEKVGDIWYYLSESGAMVTGWEKVDDIWYYMDPSGAMRTGWVLSNDMWYYMDDSGAMRTGWVLDGATWYLMSENGAMLTGWQQVGSKRYYMDASGAMQTGAKTIDGKQYFFNGSGELVEGSALDVTVFGAKPDDGVDDTAAFNKAVNSIGRDEYANYQYLYVPAGTYDINADPNQYGRKGIVIERDNLSIMMDAGAVLKAIPTASEGYAVLFVQNAKNVSITGGTIQGERAYHKGSGGQSGVGVLAYHAQNLTISNMTINDCWGDGISLAAGFYYDNGTLSVANCNGVQILNCTIHNNRRDNISITGADNVSIDGCKIYDANGTPNQCGMLIEPYVIRDDAHGINTYMPCKNISVTNSSIYAYQNRKATQEAGRQFFAFATFLLDDATKNAISQSDHPVSHSCENVTIRGCKIYGDVANYSGQGMKIRDTIIYGSIEYQMDVDVQNTTYEKLVRY